MLVPVKVYLAGGSESGLQWSRFSFVRFICVLLQFLCTCPSQRTRFVVRLHHRMGRVGQGWTYTAAHSRPRCRVSLIYIRVDTDFTVQTPVSVMVRSFRFLGSPVDGEEGGLLRAVTWIRRG
jgi:hypothetical protein